MVVKLGGNLLKIAAYSEDLELDIKNQTIIINFRSRNGMSEVMDFMNSGTKVIGTIDDVSINAVEINYNLSNELDECGIPISSTCKIKYEWNSIVDKRILIL